MITSTNLKALRNLEAFQVYSDVSVFLKEEEVSEEPLKGVCDAFNARLQEYDTALLPERRDPQTAFEKLCEMINALAVVKGASAYSRLIDRINRVVREAQEVVARRLARGKKAVEAEGMEE